MQAQDNTQKIQYLPFESLPAPSAADIAQTSIELGLTSPEWFIQFHTITKLRQANRHYSSLFLNELLPRNLPLLLSQADNLRSNNSKEALTLLTEIIQTQPLIQLETLTIRPMVSCLLAKSTCQKAFLRNQAIKALNLLPLKWNPNALEELCAQTQTLNSQISQLAIRLVSEMVDNHKEYQPDGLFLKNLSKNINGKRSVLQKRAKEILINLKDRQGEEQLELTINSSAELLEEESNTLRRELHQKEQKAKTPSLRQFLKQKKQEQ